MGLDFHITPYQGAGLVNFGDSEESVESVLGTPSLRKESDYHPALKLDPVIEARYYELNISLAFNLEDKLVFISFQKENSTAKFNGRIFVNGIDCFNDPDALDKLISLDGNPYEWVGFIMLMNLGLRLGGFHEFDDAGPTVSMFMKDRFKNKEKRFSHYVRANP